MGKVRLMGSCPMVAAARVRLCRFIVLNQTLASTVERGTGEKLILKDRRLWQVPAAVTQLRQLQKLHLDSNYLVRLPACLADIDQLEELHLSHNLISDLSQYPFHKMTQLTTLNLSHNLLASVPFTLATDCPSLTHLFLSHNQLASPLVVPIQLLAASDILVRVDLQENPCPLFKACSSFASLTQLAEEAGNFFAMQSAVVLTQVGVANDCIALINLIRCQDEGKLSKMQANSLSAQMGELFTDRLAEMDVATGWPLRRLVLSMSSDAAAVAQDGKKIKRSLTLSSLSSESDMARDVVAIESWNHTLSGSKLAWAGEAVKGCDSRHIYQVYVSLEQGENELLAEAAAWLGKIRSHAPDASVLVVVVSSTGATKRAASASAIAHLSANLISDSEVDAGRLSFLYVNLETGYGMKSLRRSLSKAARSLPTAGYQMDPRLTRQAARLRELLVAEEEKREPGQLIDGVLLWSRYAALADSCGIEKEDLAQVTAFLGQHGSIVAPKGENAVILSPSLLLEISTLISSATWAMPSASQLVAAWSGAETDPRSKVLLQVLEESSVIIRLPEDVAASALSATGGATAGGSGPFYLVASSSPEDVVTDSVLDAVRIFSLGSIPSTLYRDLALTLFSNVAAASDVEMELWKDAIVIKGGENKATASVRIDFVLKAIVTRNWDASNTLSSAVYDTVQQVAEAAAGKVDVKIPCPHCLQAGAHIYEAFKFDVRDVQQRASQGEPFMACGPNPTSGPLVLIAVIAPDIALSDLTHLVVTPEDFEVQEKVGEGGFATVYKASLKGEVAAAKVLNLAEDVQVDESNAVFTEFRKEASLMAKLQHRNIVSLRGLCMKPLCVLTDFCGHGDLRGYLTSRQKAGMALEEGDVLQLLSDIASGMHFLHSATPPILHRDLKSPNILLENTPESLEGVEGKRSRVMAKVADFGLSTRSALPCAERMVDNPLWLAPEVILHQPYSTAADVYAFGIIAYEVVTGLFPFTGVEYRFMYELEEIIVAGKRPVITPDVPADLAALMRRCWAPKPADRPTFATVVLEITKMRQQCSERDGQVFDVTHQAIPPEIAVQLTSAAPSSPAPSLPRQRMERSSSVDLFMAKYSQVRQKAGDKLAATRDIFGEDFEEEEDDVSVGDDDEVDVANEPVSCGFMGGIQPLNV